MRGAMIVPLALWHLFAACAPRVAPMTMSALVAYESRGNPYAIDDDTAGRSYAPPTRAAAEALALRLLAAGHEIDVGYAQINSTNFAAFGLDPHTAFDPCRNVAAGGTLLLSAYAAAVARRGAQPPPLAYALSTYNSGGPTRALGYARAVFATSHRLQRPAP
jgi:type IV secretion system protein VirB1